ncbi:MAG: biopolymer transporter ExbD [Methylococcales bacterium]|jgi:biopolymer transport protein ExbD|nr:biopolymer transporter ExbD [Methylococcales bacterium]MDD5755496.1 biopolymer transporter ExbD [Methylococcales bacterium]
MKIGEEGKIYDDINITPMLDVAYVLLLIFIIMTTATVQGITVNLPKASSTPALAKPKTKAISITKDGTIYLDTYPVSIEELETRLGQYKAATPDLPVVVKADGAVEYQKVVSVLDVVTRLEISQLGLVTQKLVK